MRQRVSPFLVFSAMLVAGSGVVRAQESVPAELAKALIDRMYDADAGFVVGSLPQPIPAEVVPEGAVVLGGLGSEVQAMAVLDLRGMPQDTRAILTGIGERLQRSGRQPAGDLRSVFNPAATGPMHLRMHMPESEFCREGTTLRLRTRSYRSSRNAATMLVEWDRRPNPFHCDRSREPVTATAIVPALRAPDGSSVHGISSGGTPEAYQSMAGIVTSLGTQALAEHFAAQLRAEGWAVEERAISETVASYSLRYGDESAVEWTGRLGIAAVPGFAQRYVFFEVEREGSEIEAPWRRAVPMVEIRPAREGVLR